MSLCTRGPGLHPRTASGETTPAARLSDQCRFIQLFSIFFHLLAFATGTSMQWKHPLLASPQT